MMMMSKGFRSLMGKNWMTEYTSSFEYVLHHIAILTHAILGLLLSADGAICLLMSPPLKLTDNPAEGFLFVLLEILFTFSSFHLIQPCKIRYCLIVIVIFSVNYCSASVLFSLVSVV